MKSIKVEFEVGETVWLYEKGLKKLIVTDITAFNPEERAEPLTYRTQGLDGCRYIHCGAEGLYSDKKCCADAAISRLDSEIEELKRDNNLEEIDCPF